jgi:dynein heavy chain
MHECDRVFGDRLMGEEDKSWFRGMLNDVCLQTLKKDYNAMVRQREEEGGGSAVIFGDFDNSGRYLEVQSLQTLQETLVQSLDDYNGMNNSAPMHLVLFNQAIQHIARILRVVRTPKGHCLLIGVGGSGRKSLATLATYIADYKLFTIRPTKGYSREDWREDMKN